MAAWLPIAVILTGATLAEPARDADRAIVSFAPQLDSVLQLARLRRPFGTVRVPDCFEPDRDAVILRLARRSLRPSRVDVPALFSNRLLLRGGAFDVADMRYEPLTLLPGLNGLLLSRGSLIDARIAVTFTPRNRGLKPALRIRGGAAGAMWQMIAD
ncbi:hypothetical protein BH09PSE4_BH09PSE4_03540 [soil metagenome]